MIPCRALNQELTAGTPDREKRQRDEAHLDPVEDATLFRDVIGHKGSSNDQTLPQETQGSCIKP